MRRHFLFVLMLAAASLSLYHAAALAQHPAGGGAPSAPRSDVNNPNARPDVTQPEVQRVDDKRFLQDAAMGGLTEVALGRLAVEKGSNDAVKQFGQQMIDAHTKANDELKQLAAAGGLNVPDTLDSKHQSRVDKLAKLSGVDFDKAYIKDQLKYHQQNVKEFQQEADYGFLAQVKNLASKDLPMLQQQLELAKDLSKNRK